VETSVIYLLSCCLVIYNSWVTFLTWRTKELERKQKFSQLAFVWLVPFLGAVVVHGFNRMNATEPEKRKTPGVEPQADQGIDHTSFRDYGPD
jgi:hypothetical protein